jgi:hypothetical protein
VVSAHGPQYIESIHFRAPASLIREVERLADGRGTISQVVREAVYRYVRAERQAEADGKRKS